jgi:hypothetical protein
MKCEEVTSKLTVIAPKCTVCHARAITGSYWGKNPAIYCDECRREALRTACQETYLKQKSLPLEQRTWKRFKK